MGEQFFDTGKTPHITITAVTGELTIQSWIRSSVSCQGADFSAEMPQLGQITASSQQSLTLFVPEKSNLIIEQCTGLITIKHIQGDINITLAAADLTLNDVAQVVIEQVDGSLNAQNINGRFVAKTITHHAVLRRTEAVQLTQVGGDLTLQYANGFVDIGTVSGHIELHTVNGDSTISHGQADAVCSNLGGLNQIQVEGSLQLNGGLAQGEHLFQAGGDILVDWPFDAPGTFIVTGTRIENNLPLANTSRAQEETGTRLTGHIEDGKAIVILKAGQLVRLGDSRMPPMPEPAPLVAAETVEPVTLDALITAVSQAIADVAATLSPERAEPLLNDPGLAARLATALRPYLAAIPATPAATDTPPALSRGQQAFDAAEKAVVKSLQKAQDHLKQTEQQLTAAAPVPPASVADADASAATDQPASEPVPSPTAVTVPDNRQQILRLLRDGLISVEQADLLLAAL